MNPPGYMRSLYFGQKEDTTWAVFSYPSEEASFDPSIGVTAKLVAKRDVIVLKYMNTEDT